MDEFKPWGMEEKAFLMLMHLSQLLGFIVPGAGLVLPIIMWATNKDQSNNVDLHGKVILNWMISAFIYSIICIILTFAVIGIFGFMILALIGVIFAVMGAVNANNSELWHYPLSFKFFAVDSKSLN